MIKAKEVREGGCIPFGYGFSYENVAFRSATFYPIPLNFFVAWGRSLWYRVVKGPRNRYLDSIRMNMERDHQKGFNLGYEDGYTQGWESAKRQVQNTIEELKKCVKVI